jgi:hypothetical protein
LHAEVWDEFDTISQDGLRKPPHKWLRAKYGEHWHHHNGNMKDSDNARRKYSKKCVGAYSCRASVRGMRAGQVCGECT